MMIQPLILLILGAALLGIRHVMDPDHVVAVAELVAYDDSRTGRATLLVAAWGLGHSSVLFLAGLAVTLLGLRVPASMQALCERAVGIIIVYFAGKIFLTWLRGDYGSSSGSHAEAAAPRTPVTAFGIGVVHGLAGSGAVMVLLLDSFAGTPSFLAALLVFGATMTAAMALSTLVGASYLRGDRARRFWASRGAPIGSLAAASFGLAFFLSV